uniref:WD repeat-containing and planar cell polarity effector protein fritz n=1 Tax=Cacopsylla melanoneura TaxID=428564 RepID=A0A8D8QGW5_9HEMI
MFTLFSEIHFWTLRDNVQAQDSDLGAFRYHDKKTAINSILGISKRQYTESRGITWVNSNKRPAKLRDTLRELEDLLDNQRVIYQEWCNSLQVQLMFHTGILVTITVSPHTADITHIQIDKYLLNKLLVEHLTHVIITNQHALCSYNENQITLIHFNKPTLKSIPSKWHHLEPRLAHLSLAGPSGRRIERKLSANVSGDMVLSWWRCTRDEVYPWTPVVKDVDRANIHVYSLTSVKLELLCYYKTDSDPLCVEFSHVRPNVVHSVEQKISRRGEVSVESCTYEILNGKCHRIAVTCIPLETNVCCHSFSPDNRHLLLGCIDGSLVLHDIAKGITHLVKSAFIPSILCWNSFGCAITVANEKCQIQFFDSSLSCIKVQFSSEDITPCNILDLGSYFKTQPTLLDIRWHQKPSHHTTPSDFAQTDALLMLFCEKGPLCVLKIVFNLFYQGSTLCSQDTRMR